jgi:outer membrane protein TolC
LIQNTEGVVEDVHKQSYSPGSTVVAQADIGDAIFKTLEAHELAQAARHGLDAQRQDAVLDSVNGYFDLAAAHGAVGVAHEALRASSEYTAEIDRALGAGIVFKGDALRVRVQQHRDQITQRRAEENLHLASARLAQVLHLDPTIELTPRDASVISLSLVSANESLEQLVRRAWAARPEAKQSSALVGAARQVKNGAIYGPLIPALGGQAFVGALAGGMSDRTGNLGESQDYTASVSWRVGPGGLFDFGNIHGSQARLRSAALLADKMRDQIAQEVVSSLTRVQSLAEQIATAKQSLSDAQEALRLGQERKEFGVGVVLETIQAQQDLARARDDYLNIVTDYNKAQYALLRALGQVLAPADYSRRR